VVNCIELDACAVELLLEGNANESSWRISEFLGKDCGTRRGHDLAAFFDVAQVLLGDAEQRSEIIFADLIAQT